MKGWDIEYYMYPDDGMLGGSDGDSDGTPDDAPDVDDGAVDDLGDYPSWMEQNKGDFKKDERLKTFKTINELSQAYIDLLGKKEVTIPDENASDDERKAFYKKIGRPDEYEIPEEIIKRKEFEGIDGVFDRLNLTKEQADGLNEFLKDSAQKLIESEEAERSSAYETAKKTAKMMWQSDYDDNMKYVHKFIGTFGGEDLKRALRATGADNRFAVLNAFSEAAKMLGPSFFTTGEVAPKEDEYSGLRYETEI